MAKSTESNPDIAQARQHVYLAAVACFRRSGYAAVDFKDITAEAGIPLAAVQRHFSSKAALALALYEANIDELVKKIDSLAAGAMADRYSQLLTFALQTMSEDREAVVAAFAGSMADSAQFDIMSAPSTRRLTAALERLVLESDDALREHQARDLGAALYAALMLVLIFWCYDRTPRQQASKDLLGFVRDLFAQLRPLYFLPVAPQAIARLASIVQPLSESASKGAAAQNDARDSEHQDLDVHRD